MKWAMVFFLTSAIAADFNLRVESNSDGHVEQQAVVERTDGVLLARNSNFFCGPAEVVTLGKFQVKPTKALAEGMELVKLQAKTLPADSLTVVKEGTYHFALERLVPNDHFLTSSVQLVQREVCQQFAALSPGGKELEIVLVKLVGDKLEIYDPQKDKKQQLPQAQHCRRELKFMRCKVPGHGVVNLIAPESDKLPTP